MAFASQNIHPFLILIAYLRPSTVFAHEILTVRIWLRSPPPIVQLRLNSILGWRSDEDEYINGRQIHVRPTSRRMLHLMVYRDHHDV